MNQLHRFSLSLTVLSAGLLAQTATPEGILPAKPLITMHTDGPAALRAAFLPTNLGKMFAGPEFQEMVTPMTQMYTGMIEQFGGEIPFDPKEVEERILNYRGRMLMALHVLDEVVDFNAPNPPDFMVTIALTPDGITDLSGMCRSLEDLAAGAGGPLSDITSHEKKIHFMDMEDEASVSLPFMHKGHAVMLMSSNIELAADKLLGADTARHTMTAAQSKSSIGAVLHTRQLLQMLMTGLAEVAPPSTEALIKSSGLTSLDSVDIGFKAHGPAVVWEVGFQFNQNDRGLLGVMMPPNPKRTGLIELLPEKAQMGGAWPFDMKKAFPALKSMYTSAEDMFGGESFEDLMEMATEELGFSLKEGFFDTFGEGFLQVVMGSEDDMDLTNPASGLNGQTIGFGMKDGETLNTSIEAFLRKNGLHAGRTKTERHGFQINSLNIAMLIDLHYVASKDLFMLGIGPAGEDAIGATLDQLKNRGSETPQNNLPKVVANRIKMAPGGWTGLGWSNIAEPLWSLSEQLDMFASELPPEIEPLMEMVEKLPTLLKNYQLEHAVQLLRTDGNRWVQQMIW